MKFRFYGGCQSCLKTTIVAWESNLKIVTKTTELGRKSLRPILNSTASSTFSNTLLLSVQFLTSKRLVHHLKAFLLRNNPISNFKEVKEETQMQSEQFSSSPGFLFMQLKISKRRRGKNQLWKKIAAQLALAPSPWTSWVDN